MWEFAPNQVVDRHHRGARQPNIWLDIEGRMQDIKVERARKLWDFPLLLQREGGNSKVVVFNRWVGEQGVIVMARVWQ